MCAAFSNTTPPTIRTALTISRPQNCERNAPESVGTLSLPVGTHSGTASRCNSVDFCLGQADIHRVTGASWVKFLAWAGGVRSVAIGLATAPGPFQLIVPSIPNTGVGLYPTVLISAFAVPSSNLLHVLSLRQLRRASRHGRMLGSA